MLPLLLGAGRVAAGVVQGAVGVGRTVGASLGQVAQGAGRALAGGARRASGIVSNVAATMSRAGSRGGSDTPPVNDRGIDRIDPPLSGDFLPAETSQLPAVREFSQNLDVGFERMTQALSPLDLFVSLLERVAIATERTADSVERMSIVGGGSDVTPADREDALAEQAQAAKESKESVVSSSRTSTRSSGGGMFGSLLSTISGFIKSASKIFAMLAGAVALLFVGDLSDTFNKMKEIFTRIVTALAPVFEVISEQVLPPLFEIFGSLVDIFTNIVEILAPIFSKLLETIIPPLIETFTLLAEVFGKIVTFLAPVLVVIGQIIGDIATDILSLVNLVLKFLTDPIGYLEDGLAYLANGGDSILVGMGNFINGIVEFFAGLADSIPLIGDSIGFNLRQSKVEFGDRAQKRIDTRNKEMAEREVERQTESLASMSPEERSAELDKRVEDGDITPEQRASIEDQIKNNAQQSGAEQDGTPVAQTPIQQVEETPATKVNPQGDILSMLNAMNPTVGSDGSVIANMTINGKQQAKKITASDFSPFAADEVTKALQSQGIIADDATAGFRLADATSGALETGNPGGAALAGASVSTAQSAMDAVGAGGGSQISQMNTVNAPSSVVSSTTTGVIYTDDSSLKSFGKRLLPGVSRNG